MEDEPLVWSASHEQQTRHEALSIHSIPLMLPEATFTFRQPQCLADS